MGGGRQRVCAARRAALRSPSRRSCDPLSSFLRRQESTHLNTPLFPNSSFPPSRGRLGGGCEVTSVRQPSCRAPVALPSFLRLSFVIPAQAGICAAGAVCAGSEYSAMARKLLGWEVGALRCVRNVGDRLRSCLRRNDGLGRRNDGLGRGDEGGEGAGMTKRRGCDERGRSDDGKGVR